MVGLPQATARSGYIAATQCVWRGARTASGRAIGRGANVQRALPRRLDASVALPPPKPHFVMCLCHVRVVNARWVFSVCVCVFLRPPCLMWVLASRHPLPPHAHGHVLGHGDALAGCSDARSYRFGGRRRLIGLSARPRGVSSLCVVRVCVCASAGVVLVPRISGADTACVELCMTTHGIDVQTARRAYLLSLPSRR